MLGHDVSVTFYDLKRRGLLTPRLILGAMEDNQTLAPLVNPSVLSYKVDQDCKKAEPMA